MFWNHYRRRAEPPAKKSGSAGQWKVDRLRTQVDQLEQKLDQLALTCQAMWEMVREHTDLTDSQILEKINEIDLRDGKADGRISPGVRECARCNRTLNARHSRCIYCGATAASEDVFDL